jgi:hypothetical protein
MSCRGRSTTFLSHEQEDGGSDGEERDRKKWALRALMACLGGSLTRLLRRRSESRGRQAALDF